MSKMEHDCATTGSEHNPLQFPVEILEEIISRAWSAPMNNDERVCFATTSMLVNRTWKLVFQLVSGKDVHIPRRSYISYLHNQRTSFDARCRTLSIRIEANKGPHTDLNDSRSLVDTRGEVEPDDWLIPQTCKNIPDMCQALSSLMYDCWCEPQFLPKLHTLSVHYVDIPLPYGDLIDRLVCFPNRVEYLNLSFEFSSPEKRQEAFAWNLVLRDNNWALALPRLRRLSIDGGSKKFVKNMTTICSNIEQLVVDGQVIALAPS